MANSSKRQLSLGVLLKIIRSLNFKRRSKGEGKGKEEEGRKGHWQWSFGTNGKVANTPAGESNPGRWSQQTRLTLYHWATETSDITSQGGLSLGHRSSTTCLAVHQITFVLTRRFGKLDEGKGNLTETSCKNKPELVNCEMVVAGPAS